MTSKWQWDCNCFNCYWCCIPGRCSMVMKGIFGRLLFTAYTIGVTVLFVMVLQGKQMPELPEFNKMPGLAEFGLFICAAALLASSLETVVTLCCKKYGEWKLFSPSIFIYLGCSTLQLFLLNLHFVDVRIAELKDCEKTKNAEINADPKNVTELCYIESCTTYKGELEPHVLGFEQALVVLLIIGRWLLPRGKMTLLKFSDLLIVYFGMSVDILDFLTQGLSEFQCSVAASQIVLIITGISLIQFTLDIELMLDKFDRIHRKRSIFTFLGIREILKYPEVRTILMNMLMQDGPFLVFRLYTLFFATNITGEKPTFFAVKNAMVLSLQSYRLLILIKRGETEIKQRKSLRKKERDAEDKEDPDKSEAVTVMMEPKEDKAERHSDGADESEAVTVMIDPISDGKTNNVNN